MNDYQYACSKFQGNLIKPYQSEGVRWMMVKERDQTPGGILCDEMGLGKTAQTICTMLADRSPTSTLIICPKSVVDQWYNEIRKFAPCLKDNVLIFTGNDKKKTIDEIRQYRVIITTLGMIVPRKTLHLGKLHAINWHRIVVDEAHEMRNRKSKTFWSVTHLKGRIRWCLTGTPVFNKIDDLVSLMQWIGIPRQHVQAGLKPCIERYILRRTKEEVGIFNEKLALPPCSVTNIDIDLSEEELKVYTRAFNGAKNAINRAQNSTNGGMYMMEILEKFLRCRQCLAYPALITKALYDEEWNHPTTKITTLLRLLNKHPTEKSLVFCNFRGEMDVIQRMVTRNTYRIDGSLTLHERRLQIANFNNDSTGGVFLIQIKAGGVGLNLQNATRVYVTSPAWNPATEIQAIGRAHRTGQTKPVHVCRLITKDPSDEILSIETSILRLQEAKSIIFKQIIDNVGEMGKLPVIDNPKSQRFGMSI